MMGLGGAIKIQGSGRILVLVSGNCATSLTTGGVGAQISFGTGASPTNGAALTGTQSGALPTFTGLTGLLSVPLALQTAVTGLTIGTTYWVDLAAKAITVGTASLTNLSLTIIEL